MSDTDPRVEAARKFCTLAESTRANQLKREKEDLEFQVPELQWPEAIKSAWAGGTVNGVYSPPRVMISVSKIDQPVQLVMNQITNSHLGVLVHPLSEDADDDTAEVIQDIYRGIERDSFADLARTWAADRGVKCGWGVYRARSEYVDEDMDGPGLHDQRVIIERVLDQRCVLLDPAAQQPDWSDGQKAIIYEVMPWDRYQREYPDSDLANFEGMDWDGLSDDMLGWISSEDDDSRTVKVAEYYYIEFTKETRTVGDKERIVTVPTVKWCKVNGVEVLEEAVIPGKYIPIFPVIGRELQPFDSERRFVGVIRPARGPQEWLNFEVSSAVEREAQARTAPWLVAEGQEEGHEAEFELASTRNLAMIRYKPTSLNGQPVAPPTRVQSSPDLSSSILLIQQANEAIYATTFTNAPTLARKDTQAISGRAKLADREQAEQSNSNYLENLSRAMRHEARVVLGMLPHYYDRPGRIVRTVDGEDNEGAVMLGQPFVVDPKTKRPMPAPTPEQLAQMPKPPKVKKIDLKKGVYGVSVSIGKSQRDRAVAGSDALGAIIQAAPELMPVLGPTWLSFQDFPGHQEAADLLKKMQPPNLQQDEDGEPSPEQLQAKLQQQNQMLEMAKQELDELKKALETKQVEQQGKMAATEMANQGKAAIEQRKAELALMEAEMQGKIDAMLLKLEGEIKLKLQDDQQAHEFAMAAAAAGQAEQQAKTDQQHQANMGRQGHEIASQQAKQGQRHEVGMAERGHEQALEAGEVAHEQAEESAEAAAAREPKEPSE